MLAKSCSAIAGKVQDSENIEVSWTQLQAAFMQ